MLVQIETNVEILSTIFELFLNKLKKNKNKNDKNTFKNVFHFNRKLDLSIKRYLRSQKICKISNSKRNQHY